MAEKDWAILYTDEQYLSKSDLQVVMKTSLIDGYWNDILAYRKKHETDLGFSAITNKRFFLTLTDAISARVEAAELRISRFLTLYRSLRDPHEIELGKRAVYLECLRAISSLEGAAMSELSLKALLNGTYGETNPAHAPVLAYRKALDFYSDKVVVTPDESYLAEAYARLLGVDELTKFYRVRDFDAFAARAKFMYNPDYTYAPSETIEDLMNGFMTWLAASKDAHFIKAVASLYFLDYVKPFDDHNASLAALLAKDAFASTPQNDEVFLLPFETILTAGAYKAKALETQRTGDLTYVLIGAIESLLPLLDSLTDAINSIRVATYVPEYSALTGEEKAVADQQKKSQQLTLFDTVTLPGPIVPPPLTNVSSSAVTPTAPSAPAPTPLPSSLPATPVVSPAAPVAEAAVTVPAVPSPVPTPIKTEAPAAKKAPLAAPPLSSPKPNAYEGPTLSEKEVREYILYLLETNPNLNRNQATFLASHCTEGRFYTIQQFKQTIKCAYETARTSMDKLASEGYYEKLQVKNKFVYSPSPKGEKK